MKSQKELKQLKQEYDNLKDKLSELSEEELQLVCGGYNNNSGHDGGAISSDNHNLTIL